MGPPFKLHSPLPATDLLFQAMTLSQGLSCLEEMQLQLLSDRSDLAAEDLLGLPMGVTAELREGSQRHFNGMVTRFGTGRAQGTRFGYQATVRPWLWFLTRTSDCRIFQEKTVREIVEAVFADHPAIAHFEFKLFRSYRPRIYCVQYRETDFNFVARLLEEEGIYWYFAHDEKGHKLMLVDDIGAHAPVAGYEALPYYAHSGQVPPDTDYITQWNFSREVRTGKVALRSYDFERPSTDLGVAKSLVREHEHADLEQYDWQGDYTVKTDGQQLIDNRVDELQSGHEKLSGQSNAHGLTVGHLFTMERHPRADQNIELLCVASQINAQVNGYEAGQGAGDYQCSFTAMPSSQQYRPPRRTPKPFVQGPQTAVVVGPGGEEIFTDKYGRVKVQFHWDRYGKRNEKSSCWVRTSSPWAGKSFGFIQVPRIGQEVVVDFLEGDPDQPLITGRVYNAEQMPPWELPANATQSGVLSRSSKGGSYGNANALRFEDKKGAEQVWLHAEKNQDIEVENDETHWVGHDRTKTIDHDETSHIKHDRTETVDNNETITVHGQRTEVVDKDETITIHQNRTETVDQNESISIGGNRTESVAKNETISIGGNRSEDVAKNETISIGANRNESVGKSETIDIGKNRGETVGENETVTIGRNREHKIGKEETHEVGEGRSTRIGKDDKLQVGKKLYIEAADEITLKTGDASITMKKDGTIQIKGKDITIKGSGKIGIKADGDVVIKGSKIAEN